MSYGTGTASTAGDIIAAVQTLCLANGWTLTNDILSKGTMFFRLWSPSTGRVSVLGGTGQTGGSGSTLTGTSDVPANFIGANTVFSAAFTYPMDYYIHVNIDPDEVVLIVNYNGATIFQRLMFGQSNVAGLSGTGSFFDATSPAAGASGTNDMRGRVGTGSTTIKYLPYSNLAGFVTDGAVHHDLTGTGVWGGVRGTWMNWNLYLNNPSTWNGESVLVPIMGLVSQAGIYSPVLELQHVRFVSMDNLDPRDVITIGTDKWKCYPAVKKGPHQQAEQANASDSGHFGIAVRYDGP